MATNPPILQRSNTAGNTPAALADGELAIQQADGALFWRNPAAAIQRMLFPKRASVSDAAYAVLASDTYVGVLTLTAARTLALPAASSYPVGHTLTIADEKGSCGPSLTITLSPAGSNTINGAATLVLTVPFFNVRLVSDGASKWTAAGRGLPLVGDASAATVSLNSGAAAGTLANQLATMPVSPAQQTAISKAQSDATSAATAAAASDATNKANTAQSNAISAAASDATSKANTAQSNAITAAASDATSKASAAQSNAIAAVVGGADANNNTLAKVASRIQAASRAGSFDSVLIGPAGTQTGSGATAPFTMSFTEQFTAGSGFAIGQALIMNRTGGTGHREAVHVEMISSASPAGYFNVGANFIGHITAGSGSCFGLNSVGWVEAGCDPATECSAYEANTVVKGTVARKTGIQIVDADGSTASGTVFDAGLLIGTNGTGIGYSCGIQFGAGAYSDGRDLGILSGGTLIASKATTKTLRAGLNLAGITNWQLAPIVLNAGNGKGIIFGEDGGGGRIRSDTTAGGHTLIFAQGQTVLANGAGTNIVGISDGGAVTAAGIAVTTAGSTGDISGMSVFANANANPNTLARLINDLGGNVNLSAAGYYRAPNGLIFQWTSINLGSTADQTFSWPISFPNALLGHANAIETSDTAVGSAWTLKMDGVSRSGGNVRARVTNNGGTTGQAAGTTIARLLAVGY